MMKPSALLLLLTLLGDAGTTAPATSPPATDGGITVPLTNDTVLDAGTDGGITRPPLGADAIPWPEELHPMARLDGPAVLAAHAALQRLLDSVPKEYVGSCSYSAKALELLVGEHDGLYFVQINPRVDKCGGFAPGFNLTLDWFELYAVSAEGKVLARYPRHP